MHKDKCPPVSTQFVQKTESHEVMHENEHSYFAQQKYSSFW